MRRGHSPFQLPRIGRLWTPIASVSSPALITRQSVWSHCTGPDKGGRLQSDKTPLDKRRTFLVPSHYSRRLTHELLVVMLSTKRTQGPSGCVDGKELTRSTRVSGQLDAVRDRIGSHAVPEVISTADLQSALLV